MTRRIGMWSGPRNISTAMMRAFENRADCTVVDEPFYAAYLARSGAPHPMRDAVLESQPQHAAAVVEQLSEPVLTALQYQKLMTHHMELPLNAQWLQPLQHVFLIRHPADMVASYLHKREVVSAEAVGSEQQVAIFESVRAATGQNPPVIDAERFLAAPEAQLRTLCEVLAIDFSPAMLRWPPGLRESDGVWAPHWYNAVASSTGFGRYSRHRAPLPASAAAVVDECLLHYCRLRQLAL